MIGNKSVFQIAVVAFLASTGLASAKTVCYVTAADSHAYATPANKALEARAKELGVEVLSLSQDFDVQKGTEQLNTCVARKVDGIILWPLDPQAYIPGLARAQQAKIPAILINSPMSDDAKPFIKSFTGPDVYDEGKMAADSLSKALNGKGSVVVIAGQAGNGTTIGRVNGFTDRLKEAKSEINVLDTVNADFDQQKALVVSRDLITRFGDQINGVYANDDTMARGFIDAWKEANPSKPTPPIVGINGQKDAFESIKSGEMYATIVQSPVEDGRLAINTIAEIIDGKEVKDRLPIPLTVVTKDNVGSVEPAF
ncbi:sugar ABC transporter substrate-binding protein [Mesorhizobium sp. NPDC059054]|uniref:sugar ABC transporter substrate-binding protein n=1 Tax=Mesorhizobium sp. NPDC059054 TaxID=3346711 RepID=UPI003691575A